MFYVIFSDIHSNLQAFDAVIRSFSQKGRIKKICAGDIVGYGADPDECVGKMKELGSECVIGNHDAAVCSGMELDNFKELAKGAILWTRKNISDASKKCLESLPFILEYDTFFVVHGTFHEPEKFHYMMTKMDAERSFAILERDIKKDICFIGHSHIPGTFILKSGAIEYSLDAKIKIVKGEKYIINVGSVGQPRDGDPRACYCTYDTDKKEVIFYRVKYDVDSAKRRIIESGLSEKLGERLLKGG